LATGHDSIDDAAIEGLSGVFTPAEIVELGLVIGAFIMLGRLHRAFGIAPMTAATHAALEGPGNGRSPDPLTGDQRGRRNP
jgi:hypothetical protein